MNTAEGGAPCREEYQPICLSIESGFPLPRTAVGLIDYVDKNSNMHYRMVTTPIQKCTLGRRKRSGVFLVLRSQRNCAVGWVAVASKSGHHLASAVPLA